MCRTRRKAEAPRIRTKVRFHKMIICCQSRKERNPEKHKVWTGLAMKSRNRIVLCLFALVVVAGCASTQVIQQQQVQPQNLPRPNNIWVYDFIATPGDAPPRPRPRSARRAAARE